jgi:hypothetical protein
MRKRRRTFASQITSLPVCERAITIERERENEFANFVHHRMCVVCENKLKAKAKRN